MNRVALDRRRFLRLVGATALTAPFLRALPSFAAGGTGTDPVYLVLLFTSCGVVRYKWGAQGPAPTGTTATVTTPLVFRDTLSAFTKAGPMGVDLTDKVTVLDGLQVIGAGGASHEAGMAALWTGTSTSNGGNTPSGPSIDQAIAPLLQAQGVRTAYPTIPLMAQSSADYTQRASATRMLYDASANFVDPYTDPAMAQSALFPGTAAPKPDAGSAGPDKMGLIRKQVAAQLNSDLTSIQGRLCTEDRQQLQNLQALWNQNQTQIQSAATAAASCTVPTLGAPPAAGTDPFPIYVQSMSNILAMALACDLTRIGSLQFSHALSPVTHTWLGASQTQTHHEYSHIGPSSLYSLGPDLYNEPASVTSSYPQQLIDIDAWYAKQVAAFAYTLSQFKTASGKNLLDQTVICWGSELDMGAAHNHDDTPFVLIGSGGGKLLTNRLVRFPLNLPAAPSTSTIVDRAQNDLLLTLAKVMGVDMSTFGNAMYCKGPITEILA
ncbi:MAG TPA: DUF1552 domain-containing protein [Polyangiaceae bacterium]|nr:DUF1552 domain-containing protein [Polyangiaceae bacterium]